jgi:hypothetical protein
MIGAMLAIVRFKYLLYSRFLGEKILLSSQRTLQEQQSHNIQPASHATLSIEGSESNATVAASFSTFGTPFSFEAS